MHDKVGRRGIMNCATWSASSPRLGLTSKLGFSPPEKTCRLLLQPNVNYWIEWGQWHLSGWCKCLMGLNFSSPADLYKQINKHHNNLCALSFVHITDTFTTALCCVCRPALEGREPAHMCLGYNYWHQPERCLIRLHKYVHFINSTWLIINRLTSQTAMPG